MGITARQFAFPATYTQVDEFAAQVEDALHPSLRGDLVRAGLVEALSNAIVHGALGVSSEARDRGDIESYFDAIERAERLGAEGGLPCVEVTVRTTSEYAEVEVRDPGPGFEWCTRRPGSGRGLAVLQSAFTSVRWNPEGNCLWVTLVAREQEEEAAR